MQQVLTTTDMYYSAITKDSSDDSRKKYSFNNLYPINLSKKLIVLLDHSLQSKRLILYQYC